MNPRLTIRVANYVRLGLFPFGYGLTGAFVGGTLNRVMIADLGFPAFLVGLFFAIPLLESPVRLWLGYRSDGFPVFGLRREPYIVVGALLSGLGVLLAAILAARIGTVTLAVVAGGLGAFLVYGFGRNLGHNIFQALLADKFTGGQRPRAVTLYELASLVGLVAGAGGIGKALEVYDPERLTAVAVGVAACALVLAALAAVAQEPRTATTREAAVKAREISFVQTIRALVMADPQVRLFFALVLLTVVGTMAQDVLLEPYGALALGMEVGATTRLTMFWGVGVMLAMLLSGTLLIPVFGHMRILRAGLIASVFVFVGVIVSGLTASRVLFQGLVFVMGLGTGLAGAGMLTGAINFTTSIRAGLLMGLWGMANLLGKAFGSLMGGGVVDLMQWASGGSAVLSYSVVFGLEIFMLLFALILSFRLDVGASRAQDEERRELVSAVWQGGESETSQRDFT